MNFCQNSPLAKASRLKKWPLGAPWHFKLISLNEKLCNVSLIRNSPNAKKNPLGPFDQRTSKRNRRLNIACHTEEYRRQTVNHLSEFVQILLISTILKAITKFTNGATTRRDNNYVKTTSQRRSFDMIYSLTLLLRDIRWPLVTDNQNPYFGVLVTVSFCIIYSEMFTTPNYCTMMWIFICNQAALGTVNGPPVCQIENWS